MCEDSQVSNFIKVIMDEANTGAIGDGKIYVRTIDEVIRIRTGQTGADAFD